MSQLPLRQDSDTIVWSRSGLERVPQLHQLLDSHPHLTISSEPLVKRDKGQQSIGMLCIYPHDLWTLRTKQELLCSSEFQILIFFFLNNLTAFLTTRYLSRKSLGVFFAFLFLRQNYSVYPWLVCISLCRSNWPQTGRDPLACSSWALGLQVCTPTPSSEESLCCSVYLDGT